MLINVFGLSFCSYKSRLIMREIVRAFAANEDGATAIEYTLIAALIAVVIITGLTTIGTNLNTSIASIATDLR